MMLLIDNTGGIDYITVLRQYLDFVCFDNQLILKIVSKKQKTFSYIIPHSIIANQTCKKKLK